MEFTLKRASDCLSPTLNEKIDIFTIEDLKSILDNYPYNKNAFDMDALIIDFRNKVIEIYDDYVE